ncbi:MAG TPA: 16S rRNA (adenine(1518)-N(6)/adenine(1519)-N(6))-dimethyltransferase RsmA, partial [Anaerolineaceae bacterium]|nr:16S rRNA (adenine(1518)-N(6)/adenine(1519)-N(6))-dimethyltransferase RsmA [Anaerolineaceae bacterium]
LPPLDLPAKLRAHHLTPKKSLGQNFLLDDSTLRRIVAAAEIPPHAEVLEIGPGAGSLTRYLALAAQRVVAVELDAALIPILGEVLAGVENVSIVHGDILKQNPSDLMHQPGYWVVANIPYYITSSVIRHLLEASVRPACVVLTIQREVAERICAAPGDLSLLALSVQLYGRPRAVARIPAGAFYPPPKVDSTVLRVDLYDEPRIPQSQIEDFFRLAKAGFSQKRKTLRNSLSGGLGWKPDRAVALLAAAEIDPMRRAETLSIEEWARLTQQFCELAK